MIRLIPHYVALYVLVAVLCIVGIKIARADGSGSAVATMVGSGSGSAVATMVGSGSGSAVAAPAAAPTAADTLHDPTTDPLGAVGDFKAAKKSGWPILVLVVLIALTKAMTFLGGYFAPLGKWLSTGKHAMYVATGGTMLALMYNTLIAGGSWYAALLAVGGIVIALVSPHAPAAAQTKAQA